jgi:hypothetical protein
MTLFVKQFALTRLSPPCVVPHLADFNFEGIVFCTVTPTTKILEKINKPQLVPAHLQVVKKKTSGNNTR